MSETIPDLSLALPFYNEEEGARDVVQSLQATLDSARIDYELVLVNNGSKDCTGEILDGFSRSNPRIRVVTVPINQGYGWGISQGLAASRGRYVGYMCADGQILSDDLIRVFEAIKTNSCDIAKVMRVSRQDGIKRKIISALYNALFSFLFGTHTPDVNGTPKIFRRELLNAFHLTSKDWFIDAELILKARTMNFKIQQVPVQFLKREKGKSNVRFQTIVEFIRNIISYRLGVKKI